MTPSTVQIASPRRATPSFVAATASIVALFLLLTIFNNNPIGDEGLHLLAVERLIDGNWQQPNFLPMPLTYHFLTYLPAKIFGPELWVLRLVNATLSVAMLWILKSTSKIHNFRENRLLHVAWLPLIFPFTVLAYTESASLLMLTAGLFLHLRKIRAWSALAILDACLIRQSNIVWIAFFTAWIALDVWQEKRRAFEPSTPQCNKNYITIFASQAWLHVLILFAAALFFVTNKGFNIIHVEGNRFRFNSAQLYLFALFLVVLWGPIWIPSIPTDFIALARWLRRRPRLGTAVIVLSVLAATGAVVTYWNPHPWNHNPNYLRNHPLMLMEQSLIARGVAVSLVLLAIPGLARRMVQAPNCHLLLLTSGFSLAYLTPHPLVEPRYYVLPLVFLQFFLDLKEREQQRLTIWYGLISAAVACHLVIAGHRGGGLW